MKTKDKSRLAKQKLCARITHFLYISLLSLNDCEVKRPNFTFYGGHKHKTTMFFLFVNLDTVLQSSTNGNIATI